MSKSERVLWPNSYINISLENCTKNKSIYFCLQLVAFADGNAGSFFSIPESINEWKVYLSGTRALTGSVENNVIAWVPGVGECKVCFYEINKSSSNKEFIL